MTVKLSTLRDRAKMKRAVIRQDNGTYYLIDSETFLTVGTAETLGELETKIAWMDNPDRADFSALGGPQRG